MFLVVIVSYVCKGSPQWLTVEFHQPVRLEGLQMMFQGGFVGQVRFLTGFSVLIQAKECILLCGLGADAADREVFRWNPGDINDLQVIHASLTCSQSSCRNFRSLQLRYRVRRLCSRKVQTSLDASLCTDWSFSVPLTLRSGIVTVSGISTRTRYVNHLYQDSPQIQRIINKYEYYKHTEINALSKRHNTQRISI